MDVIYIYLKAASERKRTGTKCGYVGEDVMSAMDRISMFHLGRADRLALAAGGIGRALAEAWTGLVWGNINGTCRHTSTEKLNRRGVGDSC